MNDQGYDRGSKGHSNAHQETDMTDSIIAGRGPIAVDVEAGKTYYWCSCGRSTTQPFCNGAHQGSGFEPMSYVAQRSMKVYFCSCKRSAKAPLCDGSHKSLPQGSP
jgi:CDGSH iron-sulfur domain-containing protein 3